MIFKDKPTRRQAEQKEALGLFADLDAMISKPVLIRVLGEDHILHPLSLEQFFLITQKWSELDRLKTEDNVSVETALDKYHEVICVALPTITREAMNKMELPQIGALLQIVIETVVGKTFGDSKKKVI